MPPRLGARLPRPDPDTVLGPRFRVELRRRGERAAPVEAIEVRARSRAAVRHAIARSHPECTIVAIVRQ